jgi:hypothetical protein
MGQEKKVNAIHIDGPSWVSAPSRTSILLCGVYKTNTIISLLEMPIFSFMLILYNTCANSFLEEFLPKHVLFLSLVAPDYTCTVYTVYTVYTMYM